MIELKPSWLERFDYSSKLTTEPATFRGGKALGLALRVYEEFRALDDFSHLAVEGLLLEIVAEISRGSRKVHYCQTTTRIELVKELIHSQIQEPLTLSSLAKQVSMHPVYLAQAFRKACGCTVGEYVRRLRIEFACRELTDPTTTISQIAAAAGFFDQSHFTRTFKRLLGVTPAEFRKQLTPH